MKVINIVHKTLLLQDIMRKTKLSNSNIRIVSSRIMNREFSMAKILVDFPYRLSNDANTYSKESLVSLTIHVDQKSAL